MPVPRFVDLHSHLVPAVDDGAASVEESLAALAALQAEGVATVVTTPHLLLPRLDTVAAVERELDRHRRAFDILAATVDGRGDLPTLGLGQEIWAPDRTALTRALGRAGLGLDGSRFLLVEFGFDLQGTHEDVIAEASGAGRGVVIAHPERYHYLPGIAPLDQMRRWRELGALLQVNAGSFTGHYRGYSPRSEELAWEMVESGLVDLVATDHHGPRRRGVSLEEAYRALAERGHTALAERVMVEGPELVVRGGQAATGAAVRTPGAAG